jgi:hypothetical protein
MGCDVILSTGLFPATASMGLDDEPAAGELAAGELAAGGLAAGELVTARELAISGDLAESGEGDSERAIIRAGVVVPSPSSSSYRTPTPTP